MKKLKKIKTRKLVEIDKGLNIMMMAFAYNIKNLFFDENAFSCVEKVLNHQKKIQKEIQKRINDSCIDSPFCVFWIKDLSKERQKEIQNEINSPYN